MGWIIMGLLLIDIILLAKWIKAEIKIDAIFLSMLFITAIIFILLCLI